MTQLLTPTVSVAESQAIYRFDFTSFIERSFRETTPQTKLHMGEYIELIATKLEDCRKGKIKRLIINLPPRYLKSHCVSVAMVAWLLGHNPATRVICASYGQDLADKHARDCRIVMTSPWYKRLFRTRLAPDRTAVSDFNTTDRGFRLATSVGGPLTGRGGDYIIIDDPLKPDDALSESKRNAVNEWFDNTMLTRLDNKTEGCIIIIMQRLHQNDLVGHVTERGKWEILSLPAIAEENETHIIRNAFGKRLYKRRAGELLLPERDGLETFEKIRKDLGDYNYSSQYQQNPAPQGGAVIKHIWLRYYVHEECPAKFNRIVQSWDTANKVGELNDYSVCTTWGEKDGRFYLLHVFRRRMEYPDLKRAIRDQAMVHNANIILIEDKASGTQLIQEMISERMSGITRYEPPPCEKEMRLRSQSAAFENGLVLLPKEAHWLEEYVKELTGFPGCRYDDQVDSTAQALDYLRKPMPFYRIRQL